MTGVHLGPADGIGYLTANDELDEVELGGRADFWLTKEQFTRVYSREADRVRATILYLMSSVASGTDARGLPFPPEFWPPSAGEMKVVSSS